MNKTQKDKQMMALKIKAEKKQLLLDYLAGDHKAPRNRREFLASGLLSFSASVLAPTLPSLISSSAWAEELECTGTTGNTGTTGDAGMPAYVHIQLAGGAALFANAIPRGPNGAPFAPSDYAKLGLGRPAEGNFFSNNAPFWVAGTGSSGSPMFNKFFSILSAAGDTDILTNSAFVQVSAESVDDNANNKQDLSGMLQLAGLAGSNLPYLQTGATNRFKPALVPGANLLRANTAAAIKSSIKLDGALGTFSGNVTQNSVAQGLLIKAIEDLNKYQVEQLARTPSSHASQKIFKHLIQCASNKNSEILGTPVEIDIYSAGDTADLATVWARNETANNTNLARAGQAIGACVRGYTGATLITLGGYDYHLGRTRAQANAKDAEAGSVLARTLQSAKRKNKKMFIFVSTDGSLGSPNDGGAGEDVNWRGDIPTRSMGYLIAYDPAGAPSTAGFNGGSYKDASFQLNHFSSALKVANVNPIGAVDANELYAAAVFLNYISFAGKKELIEKPELAAVKQKLMDAAPSGVDIFDYYTRIKS